MNDLFYFVMTGLGVAYFLIAAFTDIEVLIGKLSLGLPYSLIGWGVTGLFNTGEPYAFLIGFLFPFISISAIYYYTTSSGKLMEDLLFKQGIVTIPIKPEKKGEIKIKRQSGYDFYVAAAENISKPITKGTEVKIIDVDGVVSYVSSDLDGLKRLDKRSDLYNYLFKIIQILTPRPRISGTCIVCYGGLIKSKQGIKCPFCSQVAHVDHMRDWLAIKEKCPHCRTNLDWKGEKLVIVGNSDKYD